MEKLLGTWRQTSHQAIINGLLCSIDPIDEVIWEFAPKGIMTQSTSIEGIHCVNRVLFYPEQGVLMVRPNSSDKHTIYSMQFYSDGTLFLRTHNRTGDRIQLVRS